MKKRNIRITAAVLCLFCMLGMCLITSCGKDVDGANASHVTSLTASAKEIAEAVRSGADLKGAAFIASDEVDADLTLMFSYGIDTDEQLAVLEDYVLSTLTGNEYPYYFAVIRCKEGTDRAMVEAIAETVRSAYPQSVIAQMGQYNGAWSSVAEGFTVQTYDNGLIVAAYDTEGNEAILKLVDEACKSNG